MLVGKSDEHRSMIAPLPISEARGRGCGWETVQIAGAAGEGAQ
jgi:hypothetical protein